MKPQILVTRRFSERWISYLENFASLTVWERDEVADRNWILENISGKDGAVVMLTDRIDREFIDLADSLKAISTFSVGYDHIDVEYARSKGIIVSNTPDVLTDSTADMGFALMLNAARRVSEGDRMVRTGKWHEKWSPTFMLGHEVTGKVLGIYGMGRIGRAVAERATAFRMKVIYNSRSPKDLEHAHYVTFEDLLGKSDFVMVTVSLSDETRHSIGKKALSLMKKESILINISRGPVVDENALYEALRSGTITGAALDVFGSEPINEDNPLLKLENVILSPHLGSATLETRDRMAEVAARNIEASLSGKDPMYVV